MLDKPTFLGISMEPRKNRRLLVTVTYTILVAFIAVVAVRPSWVDELGFLGNEFFVLAVTLGLLLTWYWFPRLTKLTPLGRRPDSVEITRLGLTPGPPNSYGPDEREVTIRNAAYYQASRFVTYYSIGLFFAFLSLDCLNRATAGRVMVALLLLLILVASSLPQAIILRAEPDAPEEDQP